MAYKYHVSQTKVICISSFAKKPVRGIAKCDTNFDAFDVETGKKLARLRCDVKVSEKRKNRATLKLAEAQEAYEAAKARLEKMQNYVADATVEYANAQKELADFEETL